MGGQNLSWHETSIDEAASRLRVNPNEGLSKEEVRERIQQYGPNEITKQKKRTLLSRFIEQFADFLILILLGASVVSFLVGEPVDAIVIFAIIFINAVLGLAQELKADHALEALQEMTAPQASVLRCGQIERVLASEVVPGDVVLLSAGDYIPADVRLVEANNLQVDEASLTGESVPVLKDTEKLEAGTPLAERSNLAYSGTVITNGRGRGLVVATGMKTEFGQIAGQLQVAKEEQTPLQVKLAQLGKWIGIIVLVVCAFVFLASILRGDDLIYAFMTAISLAVAAIPEGLPAVVTIVLALGIKRMAERNVIVRRLLAVETLGTTTVICSDKTGTLTQNRMTATAVYVDGTLFEVGQNGTIQLADDDLLLLLKAGALCNDAKVCQGQDMILGDPTEAALLFLAQRAGLEGEELNNRDPRVAELPFDSERKLMSTVHADNGRYVVYVKGAVDQLLPRCSGLRVSDEIVPMTSDQLAKIEEANTHMANDALRVLAIAYKRIDQVPVELESSSLEEELIFLGLVGMIDPPRQEAMDAIALCKRAGIRPVMITGDHRVTAQAIGRRLGMVSEDAQVISGDELETMTDEELKEAVKKVSVYARVSPEHKVRIVEALAAHGHIVAMTGDGVNDALALKRSHIGVAMGRTGTDVAKGTADMVLRDDNFASIVAAVEEGRVIYGNIRKFVYFLLSCNVGEVLIVFFSILLGWPVPLLPLQLLWVNLVTDSFPALSLGLEKGERNVMDIPPRPTDEPIIDRTMAIGIVSQALAICVVTLIAYFIGQQHGGVELGRTMAFGTLIMSELLRAHGVRSERTSVFAMSPLSNPTLFWSTIVCLGLLGLVFYVPALRTLFKLVPVGAGRVLEMFVLALIPLLGAELRKLILRRKQESSSTI
jgi:Ca2+-transporting ATPase